MRGLVLVAGVTMALSVAACGGGDNDGEPSDTGRPASTAPASGSSAAGTFSDVEQRPDTAVRRFYDVLGKTPVPKSVGIGCVVDGRLFDAGGDCEGFRMNEMAPDICQLLSKAAIDKNFRDLYSKGFPSNPPIGLDKTDDPKDHPQRLACLQGMGIFLRQVERDGGFEKAKDAKIVNTEIDGNRATVTVEFPNGKTTRIQMIKEKGEWKFARLAGRVERNGKPEKPAPEGSPSSPSPTLPLPAAS